jgi:UMF1 family MFS transporter
MYAWANHGWETTVSTVLIGPWLLALATEHRHDSSILFTVLGLRLRAESFPSLIVTVCALAQLALLPALGAAADRRGAGRRWLVAACCVGSGVAVLLAATSGDRYMFAAALFVVGSIAYGASNVLYNSYLPQLATATERDALSSRGFAFGYVGGGLLLAANLGLLETHHALGLGKSTAVRICFVSAGVWWVAFGLRALRALPQPRPRSHPGAAEDARSWRTTDALRLIGSLPHTRRYLISYLLFADAISAVIGLSSTFITHELFGDSASRAATFLFALILLIQFVAMLGAVMFARIAARIGAKPTLLITLAIWCGVILYTYAALHSKDQAVAVGIVIGAVLGGSQALARSLWSQLTPVGHEAAFFGVFEVANGGTAWIAPLLFTVVVNTTGSYRQAILSMLILFLAGAITLITTDIGAATAEQHPDAGTTASLS